jgi:hypothetical protein
MSNMGKNIIKTVCLGSILLVVVIFTIFKLCIPSLSLLWLIIPLLLMGILYITIASWILWNIIKSF